MTDGNSHARQEPEKTRIFIVDDHPLIRQGLTQLFNMQPDMEVCGEAGGPAQALQAAAAAKPDLAIIDLTLGKASGIDLIKDFKSRYPDVILLVLTMHESLVHAERALQAGASGYVMKGEDPNNVLTAVRRVMKGEVYLSQDSAGKILQHMIVARHQKDVSPIVALSDRELQVLELIGKGLGVSQIAEQLNLSVKTIETYRSNLKLKLNLENASALRQYAIEWAQHPG